MDLQQLLEIPIGTYMTWGGLGFGALTGLIQIAPVKWNPWSAAARAIGRAINKEVIDKVNRLETEISDLRATTSENERKEGEKNAKSVRMRILRFGDEVRHGQQHSKEHWDDVLQDITDYNTYCASHKDFKNQKAQSTIKLLVDEYEVHLAKNDFLE